MELKQLSDEELVRLFCASPPDGEAGEELFRRCLGKIHKVIKKMVFSKRSICPTASDRDAFLGDAISRATMNLTRRICTYKFLGPFDHWLSKLAKCAAIEEWRYVKGRSKGPPLEHVAIETAGIEQEVEKLADAFRSKYWADTSALVRDRELQEITTDLLTKYGEASTDADECAKVIRLYWWDGCPVTEIAEIYGRSERTVWRLLAHDYLELKQLLIHRFGIADLRHI